MKKRVLITQASMPIGGAEKALIAMLENFDYSRFKVDLFLYNHSGELLKDIPDQVNILPENRHYNALGGALIKALMNSWRAFLVRVLAKISAFFYSSGKDNYTVYDEIDRWGSVFLPAIDSKNEYDTCISYLANHYIERKNVRAKKYIAWIHTDYSTININHSRNAQGWALYDNIVSISESISEGFASVYPRLASKLIKIENGISTSTIRQQAEKFDASPEMPGKIKLLSIGRYSTPKNFPGAVAIMAELCKLRDDVVWYIIGYGGGEQEIRDAISLYNMQEKFILLGKKSNPYPYIKACDVYIQPSIYEGKSIAVQEAQVLGKPVVITNYPTASSQVKDGYDGTIIPIEPKKGAASIHELLNNPQRLYSLSHQCSQTDFSQKDELDYLYQII